MNVCVEELQRAWAAIERGDFREDPVDDGTGCWEILEPAVVVVGAEHRVGTTIVALALAEALSGSTRLLEVAAPTESGLTAAPSAELGGLDGWCRGSRGSVMIERPDDAPHDYGEFRPLDSKAGFTVVDSGAIAAKVGDPLAGLIRLKPTVVVAVATGPGIRRLASVLMEVAPMAIVVRGLCVKRWPSAVWAEVNAPIRDAIDHGRLHTMPTDRRLAVSGITTDPLPRTVRESVAEVAAQLIEGESNAQQ